MAAQNLARYICRGGRGPLPWLYALVQVKLISTLWFRIGRSRHSLEIDPDFLHACCIYVWAPANLLPNSVCVCVFSARNFCHFCFLGCLSLVHRVPNSDEKKLKQKHHSSTVWQGAMEHVRNFWGFYLKRNGRNFATGYNVWPRTLGGARVTRYLRYCLGITLVAQTMTFENEPSVFYSTLKGVSVYDILYPICDVQVNIARGICRGQHSGNSDWKTRL